MISHLRIRLACTCRADIDLFDQLTGSTAVFYRGNAVQFELGVFYRDIFENISNLSIIKLELKPFNDRAGLALMTSTVAAADYRERFLHLEQRDRRPDCRW